MGRSGRIEDSHLDCRLDGGIRSLFLLAGLYTRLGSKTRHGCESDSGAGGVQHTVLAVHGHVRARSYWYGCIAGLHLLRGTGFSVMGSSLHTRFGIWSLISALVVFGLITAIVLWQKETPVRPQLQWDDNSKRLMHEFEDAIRIK